MNRFCEWSVPCVHTFIRNSHRYNHYLYNYKQSIAFNLLRIKALRIHWKEQPRNHSCVICLFATLPFRLRPSWREEELATHSFECLIMCSKSIYVPFMDFECAHVLPPNTPKNVKLFICTHSFWGALEYSHKHSKHLYWFVHLVFERQWWMDLVWWCGWYWMIVLMLVRPIKAWWTIYNDVGNER